jgi:hypothetical protein
MVVPGRGIVFPVTANEVPQLGKLEHGPDWQDVMIYMLALDTLHGGKTGISITGPMELAKGPAVVFITTVWDALPGSAEPLKLDTQKQISAAELRDLPATVYNGLYSHDYSIGKMYEQRNLTPPKE